MKITSILVTKLACIFIIGVCTLVLISQGFNILFLKTILPGFVTMKINTALCLVLSAGVLLLLNRKTITAKERTSAVLLSSVILLISSLTLSEYVFDWNAGIDNFFFTDQNLTAANKYPGRMPVATSILLVVFSLVLIVLHNRRAHFVIHILLIMGMVFLAFIFLGSLSRISFEKTSDVINSSLLQSRFIFLTLYIAAFLSRPLSYLKFSFQKKMLSAFLMVCLVLAVIFFAFKRTNEQAVDTSNAVEHTNQVLFQTEKIRSDMAEMQSNIRGFLVAGEEVYLPLFDSSATAIQTNISRLKTLTQDNAGQQTRIDSLRFNIASYIESRKTIINIIRSRSQDDAQIVSSLQDGRTKIDRARGIVAAIQNEEKILLVRKKSENQQSMQNTSRAITVFQVVTAFLLFAAFVEVIRNSRLRNKAEAEIKLLNATLEKRVDEKTKEVIEKEHQYRFLLENMREGIQIIGYDWRYLFVNNSVIHQSKYSNEELLGFTMMEKYPGFENTAFFKVLKQCMDERIPQILENEFRFPDGSKGWFELSIQPVPDGLFILSMDISERKKAAEALIASEETRKLIMDSAQDAIICIDAHSLITVWNPQAEKIFGWKEQDVMGENLAHTIIPIQYRDKHKHGLEKYLLTGEGPVINNLIEITAINSIGVEFPVELSIVPFEQGGKRFFCGFIRDITDRKKAEINLKRYTAELKASNTELERFAYIASHDLQEPLRMVSSFLSLLEEGLKENLDETNRVYLHYAVDGAERMKTLIQALLQYSRVGTNKEEFAATNLNEVMQYVTLVLEKEIKKNKAEIIIKPLPVILAHKTLFSRLFINLISNALKYRSKQDPVIEVGSIEDDTDKYTFYVKDNGLGVNPKYFDKIFVIFQRLHNKSEYSGTGIGLAICKKIVEAHNGKIWIESEEGKGSTFYFSIPKK